MFSSAVEARARLDHLLFVIKFSTLSVNQRAITEQQIQAIRNYLAIRVVK